MNRKGVTLLELITVMMIIAFGALLLAPNIGAWLPNYRLRSATRDIVSTLRMAQMKAVSNNTAYGVAFYSNGHQLYRSSGGLLFAEGSLNRLPTDYSGNLTVRFDANTFPPKGALSNYAEFNSNSTSSSGSVTLRNTKGATKNISLSPSTGRIKIN